MHPQLIQTGWHIVIRPHPQSIVSEKEMLDGLKQKNSQIEWNFDNDNFNILNRADLLISDFSGVIYDFSLIFNKPIIYADTNFDTLPYDADWLDEQIWSLLLYQHHHNHNLLIFQNASNLFLRLLHCFFYTVNDDRSFHLIVFIP